MGRRPCAKAHQRFRDWLTMAEKRSHPAGVSSRANRAAACLGLLILLAACVRSADSANSGTSLPFVPPGALEEPTERSIFRQATPGIIRQGTPIPAETAAAGVTIREDPSLPRSQYALSVDFDYNRHHLAVRQSLRYVNRHPEPIADLLLIVEPNRQPEIFNLKEILWGDGQGVQDFRLEGAQLRIPLPEPLPPWKSLDLELSFELALPARSGLLGFTPRQTNLADWYPIVPLYQPGKGWLVHPPAPGDFGEHQTYDIADYQVEIQLVDPPPGLSLAASALGQADGNWRHYQVHAARNFAWSASTEYRLAVDQTGAVTVMSYTFPEHQTAGEMAMAVSAAALKLYAEHFGPLPHASLTIVEADFADGKEYDGLYFLSSDFYATYFGGPQNFLTTLAAHETAHQWWYALVANDQAMEPWLDEALATFSELLYYERYHPDLVDWWWEFRVGLYEPEGWVDSTIYDHDNFRVYVNAVYLRGALFLQELRREVGDQAFLSALNEYAIQNSYGQGTGEVFFELFEGNLGQDFQPVVQGYFSNSVPGAAD